MVTEKNRNIEFLDSDLKESCEMWNKNLSLAMKNKEDDNFCAGLMQLRPQPRASSSFCATTTHHCTALSLIAYLTPLQWQC